MTRRPTLAEAVRDASRQPKSTPIQMVAAMMAAEMTDDELAEVEGLEARLGEAAPGAVPLIEDRRAMIAITRALAVWNLGRVAAGLGPNKITSAAIFGASKGVGRETPGIIGRIENLHAELAELDDLAAQMVLNFSGTPDDRLRLGAKAAFDAIGHARDQLTEAFAALRVMEKALLPRGRAKRGGGPGSLGQKHAAGFMDVAKVVADEWDRLGYKVPASNTRDGGFIDLLDALHREAGAGSLTGIPALMATLRRNR